MFSCQIAVAADSSTRLKLDTCISYYQDGDYQKAVDSLKAILPLIANPREEAEAYKYLGFSYVMLDMINKAKEFFKVALDKFPQMMIDTLEVPPNITIVFKQTKIEKQMEKGELLKKDDMVRSQKRTALATVLSAVGVASGVVGGYYLYTGYSSHRHYLSINVPMQDSLNYYIEKSRKEYIIGGIATGFACINLSAALYLFFKKPVPTKLRVSIIIGPNRGGLVCNF
jgi:tetratricopeptide (TPR) repeat protein